MKWTLVYDPCRTPAHWSEVIRAGQYAVFAYDARTHVSRGSDGQFTASGEDAVAICPDLAHARDLSDTLVASHPDLCCEIYTHEGKSGDPVQVIYNAAVAGKYTGRPFARREAWQGAALWLCAAVFIAVDIHHDLAWIWGYVIGVKLLIVGTAFLVRGLVGLYEHRE
jgi:hypothetical protein